jgi:metal-responsive CopG/Arc/MetJ family transcriptional regulator
MPAQKLSVSIDAASMTFVEEYRKRHAEKSRSEVFVDALRLLQRHEAEMQLEAAYAQSAQADRLIAAEFESSAVDGLEDEAW